ncbi:hypothetical protein CVS40_6375 [Lucilia cuprina]|nr:hypothetical protein CVS40_6375 [Lucilia cuprina]
MDWSSRHKRRLVKAEKENCLKRLDSANAIIECAERSEILDCIEPAGGEAFIEEDDVPVELEDTINIRNDLKTDLGQWQMDSRTSHRNMRELCILKKYGMDLPISPVALLKKNYTKVNIVTVPPGQYAHFGIKESLMKAANLIEKYEEIICDINIDGLPIFNMFAAGVYCGKQKPYDKKYLICNKIYLEIGIKKIIFKIRAVICDAPAKSLVCGIAHHSSANGCSKCTQVAKKICNVLSYSTESSVVINDENFSKRKYKNHHQLNSLLDPMHVIDLGVTRKMLKKLMQNKVSERSSSLEKLNISKLLVSLKKSITNDFTRLPRGLDELANWKATEFQTFLLYTGVLVLKNNVSDDFYYTFLQLHCAVRLLSCPKNFKNNIQSAEDLLKLFVQNFSVTYNVHSMLHICECVRQHGLLYNFSAYDFENHLQMIKKDVRKPNCILEQLYARNFHTCIVKEQKFLDLKRKTVYSSEEFNLDIKAPNNVCLALPYEPITIKCFKIGQNNETLVIGKRFKNIQPFFDEPLNSLSALGICSADKLLEEEETTFEINTIHSNFCHCPMKIKFF